MTAKQSKASSEHLSAEHRRQLEDESGIAREVREERGVRTITRGRELPKGFSQRQRRRAPGILFTGYRPNGETAYIFRPNRPDPKKPGHKYEQACKALGAPGNTLDVHPSCRHLVQTNTPVIFVEGIKKADAILSAVRGAGIEILVVAISGVWNWMSEGEPLPDMFEIPVEGRRVTVCFDSDVLSNPNVQDAARRLVEHLIARGSDVFITFLPDQPDGSKNGADDFLASGGTLAEMRLLTRRYDPADFERVRLSRDERLRLALEDLERRFWNAEWKGQGGHTDRDVALKLLEAARRHGKVVGEGLLQVVKSWGALELETKVSRRTLAKALNRLEERDFCYRDNEGRKPDKSGAFVLRAGVNQYGEEKRHGEEATQGLQSLYARGLHLRAPRLRWSSPQWKPSKKTIREARKGNRRAPLPEPRPAVKRLGKVRGSVLDALDAAGGTATLQELADLLHKKRARDLRRRTLPVLEEAGIVVVDGAAVTLAGDWLKRLEQVRESDGELSADEVARLRLEKKRRAYRARHAPELQPEHAPTHEEIAAFEDARNVRRVRLAREALLAPNSGAAINLELVKDGELHNTDFLVRSVLYFHKAPAEMLERWRGPVLEAGASIVRQLAAAPLAPVPHEASPPDDWRDHPLDCECTACLYPEPKYARPYAGSGAA